MPRDNRTLKGVVLDYGGVLMDMAWAPMAALEREHELEQGTLMRTLYMSELWKQIEIGLADPSTHYDSAHRDLEALAGRTLPRLHERWKEAQVPIEQNVELVRSLRPPYLTAVLSNAGSTLVDRLTNELGIADLFDVLISSADVGMAKPDPRIYALAAERLGLAPEECVFVDDMQGNVDAAKAAGMEAILFRHDRGDSLAAQLAELGVTPLR